MRAASPPQHSLSVTPPTIPILADPTRIAILAVHFHLEHEPPLQQPAQRERPARDDAEALLSDAGIEDGQVGSPPVVSVLRDDELRPPAGTVADSVDEGAEGAADALRRELGRVPVRVDGAPDPQLRRRRRRPLFGARASGGQRGNVGAHVQDARQEHDGLVLRRAQRRERRQLRGERR